MNTDTVIRIGSLSAHIPGDYRYSDTLYIFFNPKESQAIFEVHQSTAMGGMDCHLGSYPLKAEVFSTNKSAQLKKEIVRVLKQIINDKRFLFKQYGKPTKNLKWQIGRDKIFYGYSLKTVCEVITLLK